MPLLDAQITAMGCVASVTIYLSAGRVQAITQAGQNLPNPFSGTGLIDPGASNTMICRSVVQALGLQPTGIGQMLTPSTGSTPHQCNQYDVSVWFPQMPTLVQSQPTAHPVHLTLPVAEGDFSKHGFQVLIARDILAHGVFIYNGLAARFTLAF